MGYTINVDLEKLGRIKDYISEFQNIILQATDNLESATTSLLGKNSNEDLDSIINMFNQIRSLIEMEEPNFESLKNAVELYYSKVQAIKQALF